MTSVFPLLPDNLATNKVNATLQNTDHPTLHNDVSAAINSIEDYLIGTNTVTAGPPGSGKQYTDIQLAVNACLAFTVDIDHPATVLIYPGTYDIDCTGRSLGLDMTGPGTGAGGNGGCDFVHLVGATGDPRAVVITFTGVESTDGGSPANRMIEGGFHSALRNITFVGSVVDDMGTVVGRFTHWDSGGADNYMDTDNCVFRTTTGAGMLSSGIGGGQRISVTNCWAEGSAGIGVHGRSSGAGTANIYIDNIYTDSVKYEPASAASYFGIEIDGQATTPVHDLFCRVTNIQSIAASDQDGGNVGLVIKHPTDATIAGGIKWLYKVDGSFPVNTTGTVSLYVDNAIHYPYSNKQTEDTGDNFTEGKVGWYKDFTTNAVTIVAAADAAWPVVSAQAVGPQAEGSRPFIPVLGAYADVIPATATAVTIGDIIVMGGVTQGTPIVNNAQTDLTKILGWALTAKTGGVAGRVKIRLNPVARDFYK